MYLPTVNLIKRCVNLSTYTYDIIIQNSFDLFQLFSLCRYRLPIMLLFVSVYIQVILTKQLLSFSVSLINITRLSLSHNKIQTVPAGLANLVNLEILNLANNHIQELPVSLSSLPKLRILNVSLNRLYTLPRGFGVFPVLEILDLTYNNLNEKNLPGNFFIMG